MPEPLGPTDGRPLSAADRAILELETGTVVGHTIKIVELGGRVTAADVAARIRQRLPATPSLTTRLAGWPDDPRWSPAADLDVDTLVSALPAMAVPTLTVPTVADPAAAPGEPWSAVGSSTVADQADGWDDDRLRSQVADLFVRPLDRSRPLWHVAVAPLAGGRTALIWRLHHALADGVTAVRLAAQLFWDVPPPEPAATAPAATTPPAQPAPAGTSRPEPRRWAEAIGTWAGTAAATGTSLVGFLAREVPVGGAPSPFDSPVSTRRTVGWARVSLTDLRVATHPVPGATVNDALLAAVTGGLRHWLIAHGRAVTDLPIRVPVSLHAAAEAAPVSGGPGNADSFFTVALPIHHDDPTERLRVIAQQTQVRKYAQDARREDSMSRSLQRFDPVLGRFVDQWRTDPRRFALAVSNIPGPRQPVTVLGHAVTGLTTLAEIGERHGLRVAAISCGDGLTIGFCADPAVVPDVQALAAATAAAAGTPTG